MTPGGRNKPGKRNSIGAHAFSRCRSRRQEPLKDGACSMLLPTFHRQVQRLSTALSRTQNGNGPKFAVDCAHAVTTLVIPSASRSIRTKMRCRSASVSVPPMLASTVPVAAKLFLGSRAGRDAAARHGAFFAGAAARRRRGNGLQRCPHSFPPPCPPQRWKTSLWKWRARGRHEASCTHLVFSDSNKASGGKRGGSRPDESQAPALASVTGQPPRRSLRQSPGATGSASAQRPSRCQRAPYCILNSAPSSQVAYRS